MTNPEFRIDGQTLKIGSDLSNAQSVKFSWPVIQVIPTNGSLVVRTEPAPGAGDNQNVCAIDESGKVVWTVKSRKHVYEDSPYTNVELKDGMLILYNWDGLRVIVNPQTWAEESAEYGR